MPDQFTQEYRAFILSDEAKGLQERVPLDMSGIWVAIVDGAGNTGIHNLGDGKHGVLSCLLGDNDSGLIWYWLPALFDLLQIIEGAGWEWSRKPNKWEGWKPADANVGDAVKEWAIIENTADMLAAAKLAVRAIGKE